MGFSFENKWAVGPIEIQGDKRETAATQIMKHHEMKRIEPEIIQRSYRMNKRENCRDLSKFFNKLFQRVESIF